MAWTNHPRQDKFQLGTALGLITGLNAATVGSSNLLHNRQAQATADALTACPGGIAPVEAFKQMGQIIFAEARALVCYTQLAPFSATVDAHPHHPAIGAITKGIVQQVEQGPM